MYILKNIEFCYTRIIYVFTKHIHIVSNETNEIMNIPIRADTRGTFLNEIVIHREISFNLEATRRLGRQ